MPTQGRKVWIRADATAGGLESSRREDRRPGDVPKSVAQGAGGRPGVPTDAVRRPSVVMQVGGLESYRRKGGMPACGFVFG